ncbi:MAG: NAD(P)-dependent oxidoreductase [Planctomycetes bacterium]|nr:NAD(P)-dependent oxidoreductase [Planctomycetota bacterium]
MKILLTGGAGYVGSVTLPLLLGLGHRVRVLDSLLHGGRSLLGAWGNPGLEFVRADLRDAEAVKAAVVGVDAVVHLAAIVGDPACARDPEPARAVNLDGSRSLLALAREAGVRRFVFASTCSNYGRTRDPETFVDESAELRPLSVYAETKVAMERELLGLPAGDRLAATVLRFATVFGVSPRMRFDLTVNEFTMELLVKKRLVVFGERFWRPYVHVRDAARAILAVLDIPPSMAAGQVFNVGSTEQNHRKQELVDMVRPHAPADAQVELVKREEDPRDYRVSFAKIWNALGFSCTRSVEEGIREVATLVRSGAIRDFNDPEFRN